MTPNLRTILMVLGPFGPKAESQKDKAVIVFSYLPTYILEVYPRNDVRGPYSLFEESHDGQKWEVFFGGNVTLARIRALLETICHHEYTLNPEVKPHGELFEEAEPDYASMGEQQIEDGQARWSETGSTRK